MNSEIFQDIHAQVLVREELKLDHSLMIPEMVSYAYGYDFTTDETSSFGFSFDAHADVELGWTAGLSDMTQFDTNYLVLNPIIFI